MKELDKTKPVQLRDGRKVRNICWDYLLTRGEVGIAGIVRSKDGSRDYWQEWTMDGRVYLSYDSISPDDLINVPEKIEGWMNVYDECNWLYVRPNIHLTKAGADRYISGKRIGGKRIACIWVSFSVGEGLE